MLTIEHDKLNEIESFFDPNEAGLAQTLRASIYAFKSNSIPEPVSIYQYARILARIGPTFMYKEKTQTQLVLARLPLQPFEEGDNTELNYRLYIVPKKIVLLEVLNRGHSTLMNNEI